MIIKDSIHKSIIIENKIITDLIATPEFARLKKISQLGAGVGSQYPKANHTRYEHSIGVYYILTKMTEKLSKNLTATEKIAVEIAGLLHDIGHGPYSHTFEELFDYDHEKASVKIILDKDSGVNKILKNKKSTLPQMITEILQKKYKKQWVSNLVSSQLDADRMDYLLRDAKAIDITHVSFDIGTIIDSMSIRNDKIHYEYDALQQIEQFLIGRYQLYRRIYLSSESLKFDVILEQIFSRVKELKKSDYVFETKFNEWDLLFQKSFSLTNEIILMLTDKKLEKLVLELGKNETDPRLKKYVALFIDRSKIKVEVIRFKKVLKAREIELRNANKSNYKIKQAITVLYKENKKSKHNEIIWIFDKATNSTFTLEQASKLINFLESDKAISETERFIFHC